MQLQQRLYNHLKIDFIYVVTMTNSGVAKCKA